MILKKIRKALSFRKDETGAVTVDWVALTAGILVIGALIANTVMFSADNVGDQVALKLNTLAGAVTASADPTVGAGNGVDPNAATP